MRVFVAPLIASAVLVLSAGAAFATQPDGMLRRAGTDQPYTGKGIINNSGIDQTLARNAAVGEKAKFEIRVKNTNAGACKTAFEQETFTGTGGAQADDFVVRYKKPNGVNVTDKVEAGTYAPNIDSGAAKKIFLTVKVVGGNSGGEGTAMLRFTCSDPQPDEVDVIKAVARVA
jgi:hypothetical protein